MNDKVNDKLSQADDDDNSALKIFVKKHVVNEYDIFLNESIDGTESYYELLYLLEKASGTDKLNIYLNSYGGLVSTGVQIINAIRSSAGEVKIVVCAPVYSMGALLALTGDLLEIRPHVFFMFHNYSGVEVGKGNEMVLSVKNYQSYFKKVIMDIAHPFLSKQEIKDIMEGKDLYVSYESASKRLKD